MHGHKHAVLHILIATHTGVDHVWSLCSCCLDCLEDVHSSFKFDSLNFRHASDEHTTARHVITGEMSIIDIGELLMSSYMCAPTHTCTHAHMHTHTEAHACPTIFTHVLQTHTYMTIRGALLSCLFSTSPIIFSKESIGGQGHPWGVILS